MKLKDVNEMLEAKNIIIRNQFAEITKLKAERDELAQWKSTCLECGGHDLKQTHITGEKQHFICQSCGQEIFKDLDYISVARHKLEQNQTLREALVSARDTLIIYAIEDTQKNRSASTKTAEYELTKINKLLGRG